MRKIILLIIGLFVLLLPKSFLGQDVIDSLKHALSDKSGGEKIQLLQQLSKAYTKKNIDSSLYYINKAIEQSNKLGKPYHKAISLSLKADLQYTQAEFSKSQQYYRRSNELLGQEKYKKLYAHNIFRMGMIFSKNMDLERAYNKFDEALQIYTRLNDDSNIIETLNESAIVAARQGRFDVSLKNFYRLLNRSKKNKDSANIAKAYNNIAGVHYYVGRNPEALNFYLQSLNIREKLKDTLGMATNLFNIANIYKDTGKDSLSLTYYKRALKTYKNLNHLERQATCYNNIGIVYQKMFIPEKALENYMLSLEIRKRLGDSVKIATNYINIARIYFNANEYQKSLDFLDKAYVIRKKSGNKPSLALILKSQADCYRGLGSYDKALTLYKKSLNIGKEIGDINRQIITAKNISELYEKLGNYQKALAYHQGFTEAKDSLLNIKTAEKINELQTRFETKEKEKTIDLLSKEKKIQNLKLEKTEHQRVFLIITVLLILILLMVIFNRYRLKNKKNKQLKVVNNKLEELMAMKDKFFSIIAHDLKSPLLAFQSITNMLSENFDEIAGEKKHELIKKMNNSANLQYELLKNLLQWSASQTGRLEFNPESMNLAESVERNFELLNDNASKKDILLVNRVDKSLEVKADHNMLNTILRNLLVNAVKFNKKHGKVIVESKQQDDSVIVSVKDTGLGMEKKDLGKLFKIDVNPATIGNSKEKGSGIGLILCKEFIEKHKSKIWVDSKPGEGSIFSFNLAKA